MRADEAAWRRGARKRGTDGSGGQPIGTAGQLRTVGCATSIGVMRIHPLDDADYLLLTTTNRDGTSVPTPVWFQGTNGRYVVVTGAGSGKVKRIRNNPRVEVAVCDARGNVLPGAAILAATARVLEGAAAEGAADRVKKKYGIKWKAFMAGQGAWRRIRKTEPEEEAIVEVTLTEAI